LEEDKVWWEEGWSQQQATTAQEGKEDIEGGYDCRGRHCRQCRRRRSSVHDDKKGTRRRGLREGGGREGGERKSREATGGCGRRERVQLA
jgi:hypothetical protein